MPASETIRELAIPVVMISANGLICLALYNRLAAITARLRLFYRERFEIDLRLVGEASSGAEPTEPEIRLRERLAVLDHICQMILRRARCVRNALILLLSSVIGMLVITLLLGLAYQLPILALVALTIFVVSVVLMIGGVALAILELLLVLEPVEAEGPLLNGEPVRRARLHQRPFGQRGRRSVEASDEATGRT
jgi:hypothetical protein